MENKTTPRSNLVRNSATSSSLKLRRRREGSNDGNGNVAKKSQHRHSGDFMQWTKNIQPPPIPVVPLAPAYIVMGADR
jgi:hypothetical protein